jgi:hypothetical protein
MWFVASRSVFRRRSRRNANFRCTLTRDSHVGGCGHGLATLLRAMLASYYSKGVNLRLSGLAIASLAALLASCGGGGGSSTPPPPPPTTVTVSGTVKFELAPPKSGNIGLNYAAIAPAPARGVRVEAVQVSGGTVAASATTDARGAYSFSLPANTNLFIRVKAEMQVNGGPSWHYRVLDNTVTPTPALYAIDGANFDSGVSASTHDLLAPSGWGGLGYTTTRAAAPFAVLDTVYQATQLVLTANPNAAFPDLDLFWSKNNRPNPPTATQGIAVGNIATTYFDPASPFPSAAILQRAIFILGDENVDTDEYDASVIAHEWGHYFQDVFSRDDSVGGQHAQNQELDLRVAFSEGWGNAFSGMATQSSVYRDAQGPQQDGGSCLNLDGAALGQCNSPTNLGWFNEASVQSLLFNFYDPVGSTGDQIELGFVPIFNVMANDMTKTRALTSIFPFVKALKQRNPAEAAPIDQLLPLQNIDAANIDEWASTETHSGSVASALPIYPPIAVGQTVQNVCSVGIDNKLGVYRFFRLTLASPQSVIISVNGAATSDPDIVLHDGAAPATIADGDAAGVETLPKSLVAGDYVIEVYDYKNVAGNPANSCLTVSVGP